VEFLLLLLLFSQVELLLWPLWWSLVKSGAASDAC
jgi:hypothetical protein